MARQKKLKEVRANSFILEDSHGETKASFEAVEDGMVFLNIHGAGRGGLFVAITPDGNPAVSFRNQKGKHVLGMGVDSLGHGISISDAGGFPVCFILVGSDGVPAIKLLKRTSTTKAEKFWETPSPKKRKRLSKK